MSSIRTALKGFLHQELFQLQPVAKQNFRHALADDPFRRSFAEHGHPLGSRTTFRSKSARKWKLRDEKNVYLVKDQGDSLIVLKEKYPLLCSFLEFVLYESKRKLWEFKWREQQSRQQREFARKKRQDHPTKLLVNLASGVWYAPDWKVLDYQGDWYRYVRSFIDFQHDLTSNRPFPFADGSVDLFYCEHALEHFTDEWCEHIFQEAYRSLKPGGGFRIVLPDADLIYERLVNRDEAFFKSWMDRDNASMAESFRTLVGHTTGPLDEEDFAMRLSTQPKTEFLDWCKEGLEYDWKHAGEHINWFNFAKLKQMLETVGLRDVTLCAAQQSRFPEARGPEFDTRAWYSLHVDCLK